MLLIVITINQENITEALFVHQGEGRHKHYLSSWTKSAYKDTLYKQTLFLIKKNKKKKILCKTKSFICFIVFNFDW